MKVKLESLDLVHKSRVEMLPLIDVLFLLLVFFIYSMFSMTVHRGIKVDLPTSGVSTVSKLNDYYTVSSSKRGELYLNKEPISINRLREALFSIQSDLGDKLVLFIDADKDVAYKKVVAILDVVKALKIKKVSLSTVN